MNVGGTGAHQQKRERLWASPHCLDPAKAVDRCPLFADEGDGGGEQ